MKELDLIHSRIDSIATLHLPRFAPYSKKPDLFPRKTIHVLVGDPVDLADLTDKPVDAAVIAQATDRIMDAVTALVARLRDEEPPAERFDPRRAGVAEIGNPTQQPRTRDAG